MVVFMRAFMSGAEFVNKLLNGERDFRRIALEERFNLEDYEGKGELKNFLESNFNDFGSKPILLNNSILRGLNVARLVMPYVNGQNADFSGACIKSSNFNNSYMPDSNFYGADLNGTSFVDANLEKAVFSEASLHHVSFYRANLRNSTMLRAQLYNAVLNQADLEDADLGHASLCNASLVDAKIEKTMKLYSAHFCNTNVGVKEKEIIENILKSSDLKRFNLL